MKPKSDTPSELSASDLWATPPELFAAASALYGPFGLDAAAMKSNTKCERWLGPGSHWNENALEADWFDSCRFTTSTGGARGPRVWCNPPFSKPNLDLFTAKGRQQVLAHVDLVCLLVPANTTAGWWHRNILAPAGRQLGASHGDSILGARDQVAFEHLTVERLTLRGRVSFVEVGGFTGSARGHHVLAVLARPGVLPRLVRRRGAPLKVTPEREARVRAEVERGQPLAYALSMAGVNRRTWYRHLERKGRAA